MAGGGRGRGAVRHGSIKSVTTQMRPGYLRKNGAPQRPTLSFTGYWDLHSETTATSISVDTEPGGGSRLPADAVDHVAPLQEGRGRQQSADPTPCDARF